ncbi:hypothetical protein Tco_1127454 [Tanacetum coccineum]
MILTNDVHLLKEKRDISAYCKKKVGNGETSIFWDDVWMGDTPLKIQYPRVYALELRKTISVVEKIAQNFVNVLFRRAARGGVESVQLSELHSRLEAFDLVQMQDRWICSMTVLPPIIRLVLRNLMLVDTECDVEGRLSSPDPVLDEFLKILLI